MEIMNKDFKNAINRKFIKPLKDGCNYNVSKLENERRSKHHETISLLKQAHKTLINVDYNLKSYNLVDANTLLRSSFEYIMMAMMIQFDESVYNEFITLGIDRDKTRVCEIIDKFRTHMNEISKLAFKDINRKEKLSMLNELYDKMCNFTHSTLIVSTVIEINSSKEKEIFQLLIYQNYHFLKMLLFLCLKYFTNDNKHNIDLNNFVFSYLFLIDEIRQKIEKYNIDFSKYNDLLYIDTNDEYLKKYINEINKIKDKIDDIKNDSKKDSNKFINELIKFLK